MLEIISIYVKIFARQRTVQLTLVLYQITLNRKKVKIRKLHGNQLLRQPNRKFSITLKYLKNLHQFLNINVRNLLFVVIYRLKINFLSVCEFSSVSFFKFELISDSSKSKFVLFSKIYK